MCEMLVLCGPDWLTDEQIEDMTRDRISNARRSQHQDIRNRKIWAERAIDNDCAEIAAAIRAIAKTGVEA